MLSWLIDLERRRLVNLCAPSSAAHGGTGGTFTQNVVMSEIPLDLGSPDQEGKLYSAESLNNLHKMTICTDPRDLLWAPPPISPKGPPQRLEEAVSDGLGSPNQGILASLLHRLRPDSLVGSRDEERTSLRRVHQAPVRGAWLLLAAMLLTGLLLSFCAIYLIARNSAVLGELRGDGVEERHLEELRRWKALLEKNLDISISEGTAK
ncbi:uncharacterized protein LOC125739572 isoform X2 [Brienomyrus brachyistius]|uniref:uncharacterized protein LOC125739572 isoform X2 n=1 Tax=Brienomyrus brachyistius TaxID=42636 RepID=UPI0020B3D5F6|nr:uncharacterized protein LOC125739572 isoform X2 [Brienomyrus brachyistius]